MAIIRLDRYLADAGQGTRSRVKQLVRKGSVTVNGAVVKQADCKVNTDSDCVAVDGRILTFSEYQYFMLHKPAGVVSATTDGRNKTVLELIEEKKRRDLFPVGRLDKDTEGLLIITNDGKLANQLLAPGRHVDKLYYAEVAGEVTEETIADFREGLDIGDEALTAPARLRLIEEKKRRDLFPVGRLDKDTEGLLIITNDGKLANQLLAPGRHVDKLYYAEVAGEVTEETIADFREGLDIGDEALTAPARLRLISCDREKRSGMTDTVPVSRIEIVITEGRYHQIKRMFQAVGMEVLYLKRLSMGPITLDRSLACGAYRALSKQEIDLLKGVHEA